MPSRKIKTCLAVFSGTVLAAVGMLCVAQARAETTVYPYYPAGASTQVNYGSPVPYANDAYTNRPPVYAPASYSSYSSSSAYAANDTYAAAPGNSGGRQLPSYSYNPQLDPRQTTYIPPAPSVPPSPPNYHPYWDLATHSGLDVGAQIGYYDYREPSLDVELNGALFGIDAAGTYAFGSQFFAEGDLRYGFGWLDYTGSGSKDGEFNDSVEARALIGKDFLFREYSISPYLGVGYRTLYNDARGLTSTNAAGYRRYNELYYLPFGIYPRTHIDSNARLTSQFEFDAVLRGLQKSWLSDAGLGDPDVSNQQHSGYGLRGNIMYETPSWTVGPYFIYWHIDQSHVNFIRDTSSATCHGLPPCNPGFFEPDNHTIEAGVQFKYHFF